MDNHDMRIYSAGLREWRKGRNCLIVGSILGIAGTGGLIFYGFSEGDIANVVGIISIPMIIECPFLLIIGGIKIWSGSRQIEQAVDMHNSTNSRSVSKVEWGFGITQQGLLGFVIKF
jgi:hypothetical protein